MGNPETNESVSGGTDPPVGPVLVSGEQRPFLEHLEELRWRMMRSLLWILLGMSLVLHFSGDLLSWLIRPVGKVVFLTPTEPFLAYVKVAVLGGLGLSAPLLAFEAWGFFSPALHPRERRLVFLFIPTSVGLFFAGGWFCWKLLLPSALKFLLSFSSSTLIPMIAIGSYISFVGMFLVASGLFFQMPIVILFLVRVGILSPWMLLRQWRLAIIAILVLAAILTPTPDMANQLLLAVPMTILYFISVCLSFLVRRKDDALRTN